LEEPNHACEPDLFTIDDIRKRAKVCKTIIYEHLRDGRLKAVKIGRSTRVTNKSYRTWLKHLPHRTIPGGK
jgi:hypothetical protein